MNNLSRLTLRLYDVLPVAMRNVGDKECSGDKLWCLNPFKLSFVKWGYCWCQSAAAAWGSDGSRRSIWLTPELWCRLSAVVRKAWGCVWPPSQCQVPRIQGAYIAMLKFCISEYRKCLNFCLLSAWLVVQTRQKRRQQLEVVRTCWKHEPQMLSRESVFISFYLSMFAKNVHCSNIPNSHNSYRIHRSCDMYNLY